MAGDGADALQVPPAIPAVDREDPEGVSGESAEAATAAANLAALARQGADDMANEGGTPKSTTVNGVYPVLDYGLS